MIAPRRRQRDAEGRSRRARIASKRLRFAPRSLFPTRDAERSDTPPSSIRASTSSTKPQSAVISEPVFFLEILYAHMLNEYYTQKWLATLPYPTLQKIFETASKLPDSAKAEQPPEVLAQWEKDKATAKTLREALTWWKPSDRANAIAQREWVAKNQAALDRIVAERLGGFRGAEEPDSPGDKQARRAIASLSPGDVYPYLVTRDMYRVRTALVDALRGYQIENNFHTRVFRGELAPDPDWFNTKSPKSYLFPCAEALATGA